MVFSMYFLDDSCPGQVEDATRAKKRRFHFWESVKVLGSKPARGTLLQLWLLLAVLFIDHAVKVNCLICLCWAGVGADVWVCDMSECI